MSPSSWPPLPHRPTLIPHRDSGVFDAHPTSGATLAGVDEVGRGPLAGPVFAAVVMTEVGSDSILTSLGVGDSKSLSARRREDIAADLWALASADRIGIAIGAASVAEIDRLNILQATHLAMRRAVLRLRTVPDRAIVDGNRLPSLPCAAECRIGGDATVPQIMAASIIAKVARDRLMKRLADRYPGFAWEANAGYGTAQHRAHLAVVGPTPHHRRSFAPVRMTLAAARP